MQFADDGVFVVRKPRSLGPGGSAPPEPSVDSTHRSAAREAWAHPAGRTAHGPSPPPRRAAQG